MSKLIPIDISGLAELDKIMDRCHDVFKNSMVSKENRPQLGERNIYVPLNWIEYKAEIFWHVSSIEPKGKFKILPCNNDSSSFICNSNCINLTNSIILGGMNKREKCIYRSIRVGWIKSVIEMYNGGDPRVKYWEKVDSDKRNRIYLRYQEEEIDYLVVLDDKSSKRVVLITAFPVFFISVKQDYDKAYQNYIKNTTEK